MNKLVYAYRDAVVGGLIGIGIGLIFALVVKVIT